jgi:hypothetical protein
MRLWHFVLVVSVCVVPSSLAAECVPTPEMAVRIALGEKAISGAGDTGYRAEDVEVDPVLRRAWVRVRRCDMPDAPAVLVPISVPLRMANAVASGSQSANVAADPRMVEVPQPILIQPGHSVRAVFISSVMHMEVEARAMQAGSAGQTISLLLKRNPGTSADEPEHRIRGTVRADGSVEVTP